MQRFSTVVAILMLSLGLRTVLKSQYLTNRDRQEINSLRKISPPKDAIELEKIVSFPTPEQESLGVYIANADSIELDSQSGAIFISDQKANVILKFDIKGNYLGRVGRPGQGPGEFSIPRRVMIVKNELVVHDAGNMRLQYFDLHGNFKKALRLFKSYRDVRINKDGYLIGAPLSIESYEGGNLLEVISPEGKLIRFFGQPVEFKYDQSSLNDRIILLHKNNIYIVFNLLPLIQIYSIDGYLLKEIKINTEFSFSKEKINRRLNSYRPKQRVGYIIIVDAASIANDHLYILNWVPPRIWIWELKDNLERARTFWYGGVDNCFIKDMLVIKKEEQIFFYLLGRIVDDMDKIHVFKKR